MKITIRKIKIPAIIAGIIIVYLVVQELFLKSSVLVPFLDNLNNTYLLLIEKTANIVLNVFASPVRINDHNILVNHSIATGFVSETIYKKWLVLLLVFFWITRTTTHRKILVSLVMIGVHYVLNFVHIAIGANLAGLGILDERTFPSLSYTIGNLIILTVLFYWYQLNQDSILSSLRKYHIDTSLLENKFYVIIALTYIYIIAGIFVLQYFDFQGWINVLFGTSSKILALLGWDATVEGPYLIGYNGTIYMAKYCLGIRTMLLFASLVYLTGDDPQRRWFYIVAGLIFLNFVNIMRFVFLFIHVQKNGGYVLSMDLHDMYNYITYSIVFILWIIWFEKFSGTLQYQKR